MLGPLDVPGEIALFGEGLIALRTLVRLLTLVDTSDMILAGVLLREFLGTNLTTERLLTPVDTSDMSLGGFHPERISENKTDNCMASPWCGFGCVAGV